MREGWRLQFGEFNDYGDEYVVNVVIEVDVKGALKSSIFVVQKAAAPKSGIEFCQGSNGTIRSSLATSYDVWRRRAMSLLKWIKQIGLVV